MKQWLESTTRGLRKRTTRQLQFTKSALMAIWHYARILPSGESIPTLFHAGLALIRLSLPMRKKAAPSLSFRRLRQCYRCPMFNRPLRTCGSPGDVEKMEGRIETIGCWCYMPVKATIPEVNCWAYEQQIETIGWRRELNGSNPFKPEDQEGLQEQE